MAARNEVSKLGAGAQLPIEQLKLEHRRLEREKTTAEANLKNAQDNLAQLKSDARERYGTDDLAELKEKLEQMKQENERRRAEYQQHLEQIEEKLQQVEQTFGGPATAQGA